MVAYSLLAGFCFAQAPNVPMVIPEPQAIPTQGNSVYVATPPSPASFTQSAFGVENPFQADTSMTSRKAVIQGIPFQQLNAASQQKVRFVLENTTMYRRLPIQVVPCEEDLYIFISKHPDIVTNIWKIMDISKIRVQEIGQDRFYLEDGAGTRGTIECIYRSDRYLLLYVLGTYEGVPFPNRVKGSGVIVLQQLPTIGTGGQRQLAIRLDAFMQIENAGVDLLARTFKPLVGQVADHNFNQTMAFMGVLSRTVCYNGEGVNKLSERLNDVRPEVREEFGRLSMQIAQRIDDEMHSFDNQAALPRPMDTAQTQADTQTE